jgi:subtilisin-like proprotein convertase family protein
MKFKIIILLLAFFVGSFSYAQMVTMGDAGFPQSNPMNCATFGVGATNFQSPGQGGNYPANYNDTITFCPDLNLGTKATVTFGINTGLSFDVHGSDFIRVYDGPSTASPLLGVHNSTTDPNGFTHTASWNNPSGCLTIVFISNGSNQGAGWVANVSCGNQFQPFEMHLEAYVNGSTTNALNPADTGYVDICFGDSVLFVAKPIFPYSEETTGFGYSQNINSTVNVSWNITGSTWTYPNNDSIWYTPQTRAGFLVSLKLTDIFPQSSTLYAKIRVSQIPIFTETGPVDSAFCLGAQTNLIGGVTPTDTAGIVIPPGSFQLGGALAGLTYLPDGSGLQYQAPIQITGFPAGSTIQNAQSLNKVYINMEHSYAGDLEIWLKCPTGLIVPLVNSYSPGYIAGGSSGGGTYLGDPIDDLGGGGPGAGWSYYFSSVFNTIGTMATNWTNTVPVSIAAGNFATGNSVDPIDTYSPEISFSNFTGCPVNGTWTIYVQDNLGADDGYIFEWGLFFDASYFPGLGQYTNYVVSDYWTADPTIISNQNDTSIVIQPTTIGFQNYTYNITDNFGCSYDTTVQVFVQGLPTIFDDTIGCDLKFQAANTIAFSGGVWSTTAPQISFTPNNTAMNPLINATVPGTYTVSFTDNECQQTSTATITFPDLPTIFDDSSMCSLSYQVANTDAFTTGGVWTASSPNVSFSPSNTTLNPTIIANSTGNYIITFTDNVCQNSTSSTLVMIVPPAIFNDTTICNETMQVANTVSFDGGNWSSVNTNISFSPSNGSNPLITLPAPGTYTVTFTDNMCNLSVSSDITLIAAISTAIEDATICVGSDYTITATSSPGITGYTWSNGATGQSITVNQGGTYTVTATSACGTSSDDALITEETCSLEAPNVIVLSSEAGNNLFFVKFNGVSTFKCSILNRWGNLVYEYVDPAGKWNGTNQSGTIVEDGTYFYHIEGTFNGGKEFEKDGFVEVRR